MFCKNCGKALDEDSFFCTNCGEKLSEIEVSNFCSNCGAKLEEEAIFCTSCGVRILEEEKSVAEQNTEFENVVIKENESDVNFQEDKNNFEQIRKENSVKQNSEHELLAFFAVIIAVFIVLIILAKGFD